MILLITLQLRHSNVLLDEHRWIGIDSIHQLLIYKLLSNTRLRNKLRNAYTIFIFRAQVSIHHSC
jgi:hypothetical protein